MREILQNDQEFFKKHTAIFIRTARHFLTPHAGGKFFSFSPFLFPFTEILFNPNGRKILLLKRSIYVII
jgi:hypothetical protein